VHRALKVYLALQGHKVHRVFLASLAEKGLLDPKDHRETKVFPVFKEQKVL